ncbi:MAG: MAPEG family protein [Betaproteobacteria bacterium]
MALSYWCVLLACLLPIVAAGVAKWGTFSRPAREGGYDNEDPRAWLALQSGRRARANAAQANSFEALPLFIAAVLTAQQLQVQQALIDGLSVAFVLLRVVYLVLYVTNRATARTLVWSAGMAVSIALMVSPVWA